LHIQIYQVEIKQDIGYSIPCPYKTAIIGSFEVPGTSEINTSLDIKMMPCILWLFFFSKRINFIRENIINTSRGKIIICPV
jgi:hypothetical protein